MTTNPDQQREQACPRCRHQFHGNRACFNMASDNDCGCPGPGVDTPQYKTAKVKVCSNQACGTRWFYTGPDNCPECGSLFQPGVDTPSPEPREPNPAVQLVALSKWVDDGNAHRDPEAITWGRIAKVSEECGEAIAAYVGATGQNPRKGVQGCMDDVVKELLDVAVTALAAVEHIRRNSGESLAELHEHIDWLCQRVGIEAGGV